MSAPQIDIAVLAAIRQEFCDTILPQLAGSDRYTGAMMKRGLDVLWAQVNSPATPDSCLRDAGYGAPETLAATLRKERPAPTPRLRQALRAYVEAKLEITNPKFLAATRDDTKRAQT